MSAARTVSDDDYERLLEIRSGIRRFLHWSEERAREAGLTAAQHQLLLAVRGHRGPGDPTIGEVAASLLLRHHSAVQLVDRAEAAGLLVRHRDGTDHRRVRVALTPAGVRILESLSAQHLEELELLGLSLGRISMPSS